MSEKCSRIAVWCCALLCVAVARGALASNSSHSLEAAQSAQSVLIRKMGDAQSYKEFPRISTAEVAELLDSVWGIEPPELRDHKLQEIREFCVVGKVILKSYLNFMDQSGGINQATNIKEFASEIQKGAIFALNCLATYAEAEGGKGAVMEDNSSGGEAAGWFTSGEDGATQLLVSCVDLATSGLLSPDGSFDLSDTIKSAGLRLAHVPGVIQRPVLVQSLKLSLSNSVPDKIRENLSEFAGAVGP